jgi:hypothetical protein
VWLKSTHTSLECLEQPSKRVCHFISKEGLPEHYILQLMIRSNKHRQQHPIFVCHMCCVKSNHITKIMTFCTLACMAPEYVLYPSRIRISLCIPVKVFICMFAIPKELQQLQNILLPFLTKKRAFLKLQWYHTHIVTAEYYIL